MEFNNNYKERDETEDAVMVEPGRKRFRSPASSLDEYRAASRRFFEMNHTIVEREYEWAEDMQAEFATMMSYLAGLSDNEIREAGGFPARWTVNIKNVTNSASANNYFCIAWLAVKPAPRNFVDLDWWVKTFVMYNNTKGAKQRVTVKLAEVQDAAKNMKFRRVKQYDMAISKLWDEYRAARRDHVARVEQVANDWRAELKEELKFVDEQVKNVVASYPLEDTYKSATEPGADFEDEQNEVWLGLDTTERSAFEFDFQLYYREKKEEFRRNSEAVFFTDPSVKQALTAWNKDASRNYVDKLIVDITDRRQSFRSGRNLRVARTSEGLVDYARRAQFAAESAGVEDAPQS